MRKIIFLDVDGVLNSIENTIRVVDKLRRKKMPIRSLSIYYVPFRRTCLKNLARIVRRTGAKVVVTSTWRTDKEHMAVLKARLAEYGVPVYDCTRRFGDRGAEIKEWLSEKRDISGVRYVVLDDEINDIVGYIGKAGVIQVNGECGLSFWDSLKAIDYLKGED